MSIDEYERARKLGDKELHARMQRNETPYLVVLDDLIEDSQIEARVSLGLVDIPLERVVGTATAGRTTAFAANFMPLLEANTEFATKWSTLVASMISEGLRDPIVVIEYLNNFYVVEGNKRVSVSKFLGGVTVEATVTRYIPKRTEEKDNQIYFEFLPFYNATKINYLWFSEVGSFPQLALHLGYRPGEAWSSQDRHDLHAAYLRFTGLYKAQGGQQLPMPPADAMLLYLDVFGFDSLRSAPMNQLKENISKLWPEFLAKAQADTPVRSFMPQAEPKRTLASLLRATPNSVKAAFVYDSSVDNSGWVFAHELGRRHLEEVFGSRVSTTAREKVLPHEAEQTIRDLINEGWDTIFTASPVFLHTVSKLATEFPNVRILNCSTMATYYRVRSYYLRMFEAKYIIGMIAGAMTKNDRIGYVADYPIYGTIANINAFALGAQAVNPDAKVYLTWNCTTDNPPHEVYPREAVDIISNRDLNAPTRSDHHFGLYMMENDTPVNLAMPIWDWGRMYESLIHSILNGQWGSATDTQALNYWWGFSSGAMDIVTSHNLPNGTKKLVDAMREAFQANKFSVFSGPIYDQAGTLRSNCTGFMESEDVIGMNYLVQNIIGSFPDFEQLKPEALPIVAFSGIEYASSPADLQYHLRQAQKETEQ